MITLITGVPGAGKTLRAVWHITKLLAEGRTVYSNIDGLTLEGVLPGVEDWRETPDGSVVVYDECQTVFGPDKGQGRSDNPIIAAFEVHRHTGHDIILITQHPGLLHSHIRRLVGRHEHLTRAYGWGSAMVYGRDQLIERFSPSALKQCDTQLWKHPKKLFDVYKSASEHTHKRRLPGKIIGAAVVVLAGVVWVIYAGSKVDPTDITGIKKNLHAQDYGARGDQARPGDPLVGDGGRQTGNWGGVRLAEAVGGCIATTKACRCYDAGMHPMRMEDEACRDMERQPIPYMATIRNHRPRRGAGAPPGEPTHAGGMVYGTKM